MLLKPQPAGPDLTTKDLVREWVWKEMETRDLARFPRPCRGRIPNFEGSKKAAEFLDAVEIYRKAAAVFVGPDLALKACRDQVLADGKVLGFATPGMHELKEFGPGAPRRDTSIRGLKRYGSPVRTAVSVVILGSVAVDLEGNRIGKGRGYGDQEVAWLRDHDLLLDGAVCLTVVHPIQVFDGFSPLMESSDEVMQWIVTPEEAIAVTL